MRKIYEPFTYTIEDTSRDIMNTLMETFVKNNRALEHFFDKFLEIIIDGGIRASYLLSLLSKITIFEHASQIELIKDPNSNRVNDLLVNKTVPVTLYDNVLRFLDIDKEFEF